MEPTLRPGDRVLVDGAAYRERPPRPGDLVACVDPAEPRRWLVKRVAGVGPDAASVPLGGIEGPEGRLEVPLPPGTVYLLAEDAGKGRDSRQFGPVPLGLLRGQVWYRYGPRSARGPLGSGTG